LFFNVLLLFFLNLCLLRKIISECWWSRKDIAYRQWNTVRFTDWDPVLLVYSCQCHLLLFLPAGCAFYQQMYSMGVLSD